MLVTKQIIKQEKKELDLFNKHRHLLMILKYLDCDYNIYLQHLFETALKLKYKVYNSKTKEYVYYTVNTLYSAINKLEKYKFIEKYFVDLSSGGKSNGYAIRLMPKAIRLLEDIKDVKVKKRSTNLFYNVMLLRGQVLVNSLDNYIKIANNINISTEEILKEISLNSKYNTLLGDTEKYYKPYNATNYSNKKKLIKATQVQINNLHLEKIKVEENGKELLEKKERNRAIKELRLTDTFYKLAKERFIYLNSVLNNTFYFTVLDVQCNKTEMDFVKDYVRILNLFDKLWGEKEAKIKIEYYFQSEYDSNNFRKIILLKQFEKYNTYIHYNLNRTGTQQVTVGFRVFNTIENFGKTNIKKEYRNVSLAKKYNVVNYPDKLMPKKKRKIIKETTDDELDLI